MAATPTLLTLLWLPLILPAWLSGPGRGGEDVPREADVFLEHVIAYVNEGGGEERMAALRGSFAQALDDALPARQIATVLDPLHPHAPFAVESAWVLAPSSDPLPVRAHLLGAGSAWTTDFVLDAEGRLIGWWMAPGARARPRAELWSEAGSWSDDWAATLVLLDAAGEPLERLERGSVDRPLSLASIFKLYVLAELARQHAAGELDLERELPLNGELKAPPSGVLQTRPTGELISVRRMAELMIGISDNTATDHLLHLVGRERVEEHLEEYGNSALGRNTPFLSTLDLFLIKGAGPKRWNEAFGEKKLDAVVDLWLGAEADERRAWLENLHGTVADLTPERRVGTLSFNYGPATLTAPRHVELGWMGRPGDIVRLLLAAHAGELVDEATSRTFLDFYDEGNPIYRLPDLAYCGYKGGGETNVFTLSSLVVAGDGRAVAACLLRSGTNPLDLELPLNTTRWLNDWVRTLLEGEPASGEPPPGADREPSEVESVPAEAGGGER